MKPEREAAGMKFIFKGCEMDKKVVVNQSVPHILTPASPFVRGR